MFLNKSHVVIELIVSDLITGSDNVSTTSDIMLGEDILMSMLKYIMPCQRLMFVLKKNDVEINRVNYASNDTREVAADKNMLPFQMNFLL